MSAHLPPHVSRPQTTSLSRPGLYLWASGGVLLLLAQALMRLGPVAWEPWAANMLTPTQTAIAVLWVVANLYLEGYRGFQKKFVPRVLARAHHLTSDATPLRVALAPLYAMAFFHARRKAVVTAWVLTGLILCAIFFVRALPQPWRGIVDAGVVAGLGWGALCLAFGMVRRLTGTSPPGDPEIAAPPAKSSQQIDSTEVRRSGLQPGSAPS